MNSGARERIRATIETTDSKVGKSEVIEPGCARKPWSIDLSIVFPKMSNGSPTPQTTQTAHSANSPQHLRIVDSNSDSFTFDEFARFVGASRRYLEEQRKRDPDFPRPLARLGRALYAKSDVRAWFNKKLRERDGESAAPAPDDFRAGLEAPVGAA